LPAGPPEPVVELVKPAGPPPAAWPPPPPNDGKPER